METTIEIACRILRQAKANCDAADKEYAEAREALFKLTGDSEFNDFGVKVTRICGKSFIDWTLAAPALGITDEMTKPYTKIKADSLRITFERTIVTN